MSSGDAEWRRIEKIRKERSVSVSEAKRILAERDICTNVVCPICQAAMNKSELKTHAKAAHGINLSKSWRQGRKPEKGALYRGAKTFVQGGAPSLGKGKS